MPLAGHRPAVESKDLSLIRPSCSRLMLVLMLVDGQLQMEGQWLADGGVATSLVADWLRPGPLPAQRPTSQNGYEYVWLAVCTCA